MPPRTSRKEVAEKQKQDPPIPVGPAEEEPVRSEEPGGSEDVEPTSTGQDAPQQSEEQNITDDFADRALSNEEILEIYKYGDEEENAFLEFLKIVSSDGPSSDEARSLREEFFKPYLYAKRLKAHLDRDPALSVAEIGDDFLKKSDESMNAYVHLGKTFTVFVDYDEENPREPDEDFPAIYDLWGTKRRFMEKLADQAEKERFRHFVIGVQLDRRHRLSGLQSYCSNDNIKELWRRLPENVTEQAIVIARNHPDPRTEEEADAAHIFDLDHANREFCNTLPPQERLNFRWFAIGSKDTHYSKDKGRPNPERIIARWNEASPQDRVDVIEYAKLLVDPRIQHTPGPNRQRPVAPPPAPVSPPGAHLYGGPTPKGATEADTREANLALRKLGKAGDWHFVRCIYVNQGHVNYTRTVHLYARVNETLNLEERLVVKVQGYNDLHVLYNDRREYVIHHLLSRPNSNHIIGLYGQSARRRRDESQPRYLGYIYLEYAPFGDLRQLAEAYGSGSQITDQIPEIFVWILFRALAEALYTMRTGNVIAADQPTSPKDHLCVPQNWTPICHLDIKPLNVVLGDPDPRYPAFKAAKMIDFGLAMREKNQSDGWPSRIQIDGWIPGTPGHHAPEYRPPGIGKKNVHFGKPIGEKSELYTVAWTILLLMHGQSQPDTMPINKNLAVGWRAKDDNIEMYSKALFDLVKHCLEIDPNNRPTLMEVLYQTRVGIAKYDRRYGGCVGDSMEELPEFFRINFMDDAFALGTQAPENIAERVKRRRKEDAEDEDDGPAVDSNVQKSQVLEPNAGEADVGADKAGVANPDVEREDDNEEAPRARGGSKKRRTG